jgi:hypothetical protein
MMFVWITHGPPARLDCDVEVCKFGTVWLVRFRNPDTSLAYAVQAAVAVGVEHGKMGIVEALVALGFATPVARDASAFIHDLLVRAGAHQNEARAKNVLSRVEFRS